MNNSETGRKYEQQACAYLEQQGFVLLEQNFRCRQGEIDLVGLHDGCLVFVEVKYRKTADTGMPEEAVGAVKQQKISRVSEHYRLKNREYAEKQVRYDVVSICGEKITWYQNAFPYSVKPGRTTW